MNTISFKLTIKDYDSSSPLKDKEIQITNIDSKKCYESKFTTSNGEVLFEIPKNERGDFFSVKLINDNDYEVNPYYLAKESSNTHKNASTSSNTNNSPESKNTTNKILTPNNYQKYPATLYFKANISLYFNGFALFVMQGDKEIASYESHTNATLENGTYFIDAQEIKDLSKTYESSKSNESNHSNNTNFSNIDSNDSNNTDSTQSNQNSNLFCNIFKDESLRQQCYKIYNSTQNAVDDNIICSNDFFANIGKIILPTIPYIKCIIDYKLNLIKSIKIERHNDSVFVDLNAPFAVGTYLTLEAIKSSDESNIGKIYWREELHAKKSNAKDFEIISCESREAFIIGQCTQAFYLSTPKEIDLLRQNGYVDFKYIIYASSIKHFNKNTAHIDFNLNFAVGIGNDDNVSESQRVNNNTTQDAIYANTITSNDINKWNKLQHIYSVDEAVWFLKANLKKLDEFYQSNPSKYNNDSIKAIFDYFRNYPQLAGKIGYIYYRFDLGDDGFIKIDDINKNNVAYIGHREGYISNVIEIFENHSYKSDFFVNGITFKESYEYLFNNKKHSNGANINFYNERKTFIERFTKQICNKFGLNLDGGIHIDANMIARGSTNYNPNTIKIRQDLVANVNQTNYRKKKDIFENQSDNPIATIIHECRHLYIHEKIYKKHHQSPLLNYLAYSLDFYILPMRKESAPKEIILYQKQCVTKEIDAVYCFKDETLYLYELQPNERDPRYVANEVIKKLGIKRHKERKWLFR